MKLQKSQSKNKGNNNPSSITVSQMYQGHLPPPDMLAQFNTIDSSFAERIFVMAEKEQNNRHTVEKDTNRHIKHIALLGIIFAFLSVLIISALVFYALKHGFSSAAATIATGSIAAVAGVFVFVRRKGKEK